MKSMKTKLFHMHSLKPTAMLVLSITAIVPANVLHAATPTTAREFRIQKQWNLGGAGGWGIPSLDASAHQLFIPRNNRVMVVDTITGALLGEISGMKNVREMALDDSGKYGYVTDPTDGTAGFVRVFDRSTRVLVTSIPVGRVPAAITFDTASKSVLAFNSHDHTASVIDSSTNQVTATIALPGRPGFAVADNNGSVFVTLPALGEIARIDAAQKKVIATWSLSSCTGPASLAIDSSRHQLFTTCEDHKLVAVDAINGHVTEIGDAPAGSGGIDFDPKHNMLFLANADGTLTVFRRESAVRYAIVQQVKTQTGARTMIVSHDDDRAYLVTSKFGMNTATKSEELQFRPTPIPDSFSVIVVGR
jgi:YVTN family beta-propeller protein